jgi:hypothetical protein
MSADAIAESAPEQPRVEVTNEVSATDALKPIGLHSPPDSNNAMKLDGSDDSELSDIEDPAPSIDLNVESPPPIRDQHEPQVEEPKKEDEDEDIGDVYPAEWSGTVPVFRPTMDQFKDFKKFVCSHCHHSDGVVIGRPVLTNINADGEDRFVWDEVWNRQGDTPSGMERQVTSSR